MFVFLPNHEISLQPGALSEPLVPNLLRLFDCDSDGLLGPEGLPEVIAKLLCDLLGASFLRVFYNSCEECNGVLLPPSGGCKHYCEYYRKATKKQQECMSSHVASVNAKLPPLLDMKLLLANCYPDEHCCLELLGNIHSRNMTYCC